MIKFETPSYYYKFDPVGQKMRVLLSGCAMYMKQAYECFQMFPIVHAELIPVTNVYSFNFGMDHLNVLINPFGNEAIPGFYEWQAKMEDLDAFYREHQEFLGGELHQPFSGFLKQELVLRDWTCYFKSNSMLKFIKGNDFPRQVGNLILKVLHDLENEARKEELKEALR